MNDENQQNTYYDWKDIYNDLYQNSQPTPYLNGVSISNRKISFPREDYIYSEFSSTLLIPDRYYQLFRSKCSSHGGTRQYISYLLSKYQIFIANGLV
ncbi:MAG TPA: hypothetical protein PLL86_19340, partial [Leptospiraceae bacterium]|nr:hypothetical protein [Leptospiraceae bacterium]